ncbi:hypothetical protein CBR_g23523 [Chara braunii]|uniref:Uncharacterized protein n=1 Tax=Chara braunii TaxID=69332 RepID=A0A388L4G1_CHABU|nr:hypothetical protein CBR_g23523 [Chara braunii]|eukprot:GBG77196.1 hypothetical protein CBR_g23523 [Chara braunii]
MAFLAANSAAQIASRFSVDISQSVARSCGSSYQWRESCLWREDLVQKGNRRVRDCHVSDRVRWSQSRRLAAPQESGFQPLASARGANKAGPDSTAGWLSWRHPARHRRRWISAGDTWIVARARGCPSLPNPHSISIFRENLAAAKGRRHRHRGLGHEGLRLPLREDEGKGGVRRTRTGWIQSGYRRVTVSAIGFQPDARVGIERAANGLLRDAASLLVYQAVLQGPPAQAFLRVLLSLRRGEDSLKVIEAYGDFYRQMVEGGHQSWQDYVLDCILAGHDNPFADACINTARRWRGGVVSPPEGMEGREEGVKQEDAAEDLDNVPLSLIAAAESDLDSLHRLCITETTLSGWVCDVAEMKPEWRAAAATNLAMRQNGSKASSGNSTVQQDTQLMPESPWRKFGFELSRADPSAISPADPSMMEQNPMAGISSEDDSSRDTEDTESHTNHSRNGSVCRDRRPESRTADSSLKVTVAGEGVREELRRKIGGLWTWSEAVPLLKDYYRTCGVGISASCTELMWKANKLVGARGSILRKYGDDRKQCNLRIHAELREKIRRNLERHAAGRAAQHVLLYGASGTGKTWLMRGLLEGVMREQGLRTVLVQKGDLKTISMLLEEVSAQPHLRFAIFLDDVMLRAGDDAFSALKTALDGAFQVWPRNAIVCATSPFQGLVRSTTGVDGSSADAPESGKGMDDGGPLGQHFGIAMNLSFPSDEEGFLSCVREFVAHENMPLEIGEVNERCKQWLQGRTGLSWRSLNQFISSVFL